MQTNFTMKQPLRQTTEAAQQRFSQPIPVLQQIIVVDVVSTRSRVM